MRDFDERVAELDKALLERDREKRSVDNGEVVVHGTHDRHQVEDVAGSAPVREGNHDELIDRIGEKRTELRDASIIGAIAAADGCNTVCKPEEVATLEKPGRFDRPTTGTPHPVVRLALANRARHSARPCPCGTG